MIKPKFSIVIACYNQRHFVQSAVESAISQPHPSKEVIAVDDGSSDGTPEVLDGFGDSIRLVKFEKNQGAIAARNHASSLATGLRSMCHRASMSALPIRCSGILPVRRSIWDLRTTCRRSARRFRTHGGSSAGGRPSRLRSRASPRSMGRFIQGIRRSVSLDRTS